MTSPLRRKRQTILPHVLTLASVACLLAPGAAWAQRTPRPNSSATKFDPHVREALNLSEQAKTRASRILQVQAQIPENVLLKRGSGIPNTDDDYFFKVETEPPTRERLFVLGSEKDVLRSIEDDYRVKDPDQPFLTPGPMDRFDVVDSKTLGQMWFQNRATGQFADFDRKGDMGILNQRGVHSAGAPPEAAVSGETLGTTDMRIELDVELATDASKFGILFRANDPNTWIEPVDQINANSYYYAVCTGNAVEIWKHTAGDDPTQPGQKTRLANSELSESLRRFQLTVLAYGDHLAVYRNGQKVLETRDGSLTGEFAGIMAIAAVGGPTQFDNFHAVRYGGPFEDRAYAPMVSVFRGSNVHYKPLYFEQLPLERYGHHLGNVVAPAVAHGKFFADLMLLPYSLGKQPPWKCHNNEGLYAPGDVVLPMRLYCPIWDNHGVGLQTVATVLAFSLIP